LLNVLFNPFTFQKRFQYFTVKQSETLINSPVLVVFISHKEATRRESTSRLACKSDEQLFGKVSINNCNRGFFHDC
jgi:hypothetical protein